MRFDVFGGDDEFSRFFRWLPLLIAPFMIAFLFWPREPIPIPANQSIFGCYVPRVASAPLIAIDERGLIFDQDGMPPLGFHIETSKRGYLINTARPISLRPKSNGLRFEIDEVGIGTFLPTDVGSARRGGSPPVINGFRVYAYSGEYVYYDRVADGACPDGWTNRVIGKSVS